MLTAEARAKAWQRQVPILEVADSIDSCRLCRACEVICPEEIPIVDITLEERRALNQLRKETPLWYPHGGEGEIDIKDIKAMGTVFVPSAVPISAIDAVVKLLGGVGEVGVYDIDDYVPAIFHSSMTLSKAKANEFLEPFFGASMVVVSEGWLQMPLSIMLPKVKIIGVGEAVLKEKSVKDKLASSDLYIIDPFTYHAGYGRLVKFYNKIRSEVGFSTNLDLNRLALSTGATSLQGRIEEDSENQKREANWIVKGKDFTRVVVEDPREVEVFKRVTDVPVITITELVGI